ncbi:hypothetical protein [Dactylosporangium sp. NPDC049140]|uniref:hypothetical protein n=1 Tax=Dactylosporangium sp. NPDC049140 TaxID=3155647 RepID=UPI0033E479A9
MNQQTPNVPMSPAPVPGTASPFSGRNGRVILHEEPLTRLGPGQGAKPLRAAVTAVYARPNGDLVALGRPLYPFENTMRGYRYRYDVGTADREDEFHISDELPSKEDIFRFYARLQFGFRVHDPAEVVRRRVQDGFMVAGWRLMERMRRISRRYTPEECADANDEINDSLGQEPLELSEGITVYRFAAFLSLDQQTQEAMRRRRAVEHDYQYEQTSHRLEQLRLTYQHELETARMEAVRNAIHGDHGLLMLHMAKNPADTRTALEMVAKSNEADRDGLFKLLESMMENNLIQNIDLQEIRDENLRRILQTVKEDPLKVLQVRAEAGAPLPNQPRPNQSLPSLTADVETITGIPIPPSADS